MEGIFCGVESCATWMWELKSQCEWADNSSSGKGSKQLLKTWWSFSHGTQRNNAQSYGMYRSVFGWLNRKGDSDEL